MAPFISGLSAVEEDIIAKCVLNNHPELKIDMVTASAAVGEGENFMSVVSRVDVHTRNLDTEEKMTTTLIMKRPPKSAERRELFLCDAAFHNEAVFYSEVAPTLGGSHKLPIPPCLLAADDIIILRHLGQDGFIMADRRAGLDLAHCQLVVQELGKYHAISFELKRQNPEAFSRISSTVREWFVSKENVILPACVDNCINMALKVAENHDTPVIQKLKSILSQGVDVLMSQVMPSEPHAVMCHGDLWSNNLLFRYSQNHGVPSDVCFLDHQACRYASPALDLLYFLFTSGCSRHFRQLIVNYHDAMREQFSPVLSLEDLMYEVKKHASFGLVMALMVLPVVTAQDVSVNLDEVTEEDLLQFQDRLEEGMLNCAYRKRVNDILQLVTDEELF